MMAAMALALTITPILPTDSLRGFLTAGQLEQHCTTASDDQDSALALCLGYLAGSWDQLLARTWPPGSPTICPPSDLTLNLVRHTFLHYVELEPQMRDVAAASAVERAALASFPCVASRLPTRHSGATGSVERLPPRTAGGVLAILDPDQARSFRLR